MDVFKNIKKQVEHIKSEGHSPYLDLILNHLERAEIYYEKGSSDEHYYNDVVYRTNQAFEGALKEAYKVLGGKSDEQVSKTTPNNIEKYLKDNQVFKERILKLFENYRQEWRNKSTHDYKLVMDENEAFLALINVNSFVHMLLKQIQEKIAYESEFVKPTKRSQKGKNQEILENKSEKFEDRILKLLRNFTEDIETERDKMSEAQIAGRLNAFLTKASTSLKVYREPSFSIGNSTIRPDFILEYESDRLIVEIKMRPRVGSWRVDVNQLLNYMVASQTSIGILYFATMNTKEDKIQVDTNIFRIGKDELTIYIIH